MATSNYCLLAMRDETAGPRRRRSSSAESCCSRRRLAPMQVLPFGSLRQAGTGAQLRELDLW